MYYIDLKIDKKLLYNLIYSFKLIKMEIVKMYIKTNLVNNFIHIFKFIISIFILCVKILNSSFYLYINH